MKHIYDAQTVARLVEKHGLGRYFDTDKLTFQCLEYQKGEILCSPLNPIGCLLFLIRGSVQIYALHPDGLKQPVALVSSEVEQIFGDIEFGCGKPTPFFVEAVEETVCLALPIQEHEQQLRQDVRFLHHLLLSMSEKFDRYLNEELSAANLEQKVLSYFQTQPKRELSNVEQTALQLRCSRRQLQRILKKLCEDGTVEKTDRGHYCLIPSDF